jgi:4-amino-4-deoxy-L-arabinose transferase-like glycosyltransferase
VRRQVSYWLAGGLAWRGAIAAVLPPGFDEAYYYLYTRHLDWSYFDHPLLVAWTTGLGPWVLGTVSPFSLRLGALLLYTLSLGLLYATGQRLFSARAGLLTVAIASLVPIFHIGFGVMTLPDSPLMLFWTATLYVASCEFVPPVVPPVVPQIGTQTGTSPLPEPPYRPTYRPTYRLALIGGLVGLACLGKYHGLALGFGLLGFCAVRMRAALRSPWWWLGMGLFAVAIAPIVIWNIQHDWISLRFQSGRAVPDRGYSLVDLLVTFLVGTAYLFPTFGFPLWWASLGQGVRSWLPVRKPLASAQSLLLWLSLPLMLTFTLMGGYRAILPTWAMPGFWTASLLLGDWATRLAPRILRRWLWGSGLSLASLLLICLSHITLGTLQKPSQFAIAGGLIPVATDASRQLLDIAQLRHQFKSSAPVAEALQTTDFLFTNDIFLAGQVAMAIAPLTPKPITCFNADLRGFAFWSDAADWVNQRGLLVTLAPQTDLAQYQPYFAALTLLGQLPLRRGGEIVQTVTLYTTTPLLRPYPRPYGN